jgi:hypothetical protein
MHATFVVLIDREREEQKNNASDVPTGNNFSIIHATHSVSIESNTFYKAYQVSSIKTVVCLHHWDCFRWPIKK